ncbi:hypothetical protein DPMN_167409 [Dreissena polymorpha]|uniref:Uncharacterized protein n=1 Tax=Dreissena polymorpha TaxID=45954 RepID=A0A9D4EYS7_DREPO|nr:hypothetical protein DPMN_167409 [Dreissena polymorpha]
MQLVTKFGEDRMKFSGPTDRQTDRQSDSYIAPITSHGGKNMFVALHPQPIINIIILCYYGHVFQKFTTIFKLIQGINITNVLTKFHDDYAKNVTSRVTPPPRQPLFKCFHNIHIEKTAPPPGGNVFSPIWTIFELIRDINKTNVLTKFHDDWAKIVTSRVFTRNTAPPPGGHVFQRTGTIF